VCVQRTIEVFAREEESKKTLRLRKWVVSATQCRARFLNVGSKRLMCDIGRAHLIKKLQRHLLLGGLMRGYAGHSNTSSDTWELVLENAVNFVQFLAIFLGFAKDLNGGDMGH